MTCGVGGSRALLPIARNFCLAARQNWKQRNGHLTSLSDVRSRGLCCQCTGEGKGKGRQTASARPLCVPVRRPCFYFAFGFRHTGPLVHANSPVPAPAHTPTSAVSASTRTTPLCMGKIPQKLPQATSAEARRLPGASTWCTHTCASTSPVSRKPAASYDCRGRGNLQTTHARLYIEPPFPPTSL